MKKNIFLTIFIMLIGSLSVFAQNINISDYSKKNNWLFLPTTNFPVDIFYLYPTVCVSKDFSKNKFCSINDENMRQNAKQVFKLQAMAFDTVGNIYAPFYTQFDAKVFENLDFSQIQTLINSNKQEMSDIYGSLNYYFENFNNGKPYILVSHSQSASAMLFVLSDYMKQNPKYYDKMVVAYVIGYPVTKEYLKENPHLKFAKKHNDTGVIVSYDVQSPNKIGPNFSHANNQLVINPINWRRTEKLALAKNNLGTLDEKTLQIIIPGIADAKINKKEGVVICSSVDEKKYEISMPNLFGYGSYHGQDFQFYYLNLRQNAKDRIQKFLHKKRA